MLKSNSDVICLADSPYNC